MSTFAWIGGVLLVGIPIANLALSIVRTFRGRSSILAQRRAAEFQKKKAADREAARRPAPGTIVVEGRVLGPSDGAPAPTVTRRHEFGCLGGPILFDVTSFEIMKADGSRLSVKLGPDPVVENVGRLSTSIGPILSHGDQPLPPIVPKPTGAPEVFDLQGLVRVSGVLPAASGCVEPPVTHSATLTILA